MEPRVFPELLWLLLHLLVCARALEMIDQHPPGLTCSQGLTNCSMSHPGVLFAPALPYPQNAVNVTELRLHSVLCCPDHRDCKPCLQVIITLQDDDGDEQGTTQTTGLNAYVNVGLSFPGPFEHWRTLKMMVHHSSSGQSSASITHQLLLTELVLFGRQVLVSVDTKRDLIYRKITFPGESEVCSLNPKACDVPQLRIVPDLQRDAIALRMEMNDSAEREVMVQIVWHEIPGKVYAWPKGKEELLIFSQSIVPCLCFKCRWKEKSLSRQYCPFQNQRDALERMRHNASVSMVESPMRPGRVGLSWNVTAPCKVEAEVWLCKKDQNGKDCEEVTGSRQELQKGWKTASNGFWHTGEFNASSSPLLCVQMKIKGMRSYVEPRCPFITSHSRWGLMLFIGLLLVCLAALGALLLQRLLKGYFWRLSKEENFAGVVGNAHLVLLSPPHDDHRLPGLVCHLGSTLQALGFSISLDLWSSTELSMLGPIPWLHSQLNRVRKQGGKVVLVLTQAACTRAEEWEGSSWDRKSPKERDEEGELSCSGSFPSVDVFSASLSCILTDSLQGCAGERFMLVQFDSFPPEHQGVLQTLPQLFRGLSIYKLPSQSLGFLTELAGAQKGVTASSRWKRAEGLRKASHILAKMLSELKSETNVLHLSGVSQSCVGEKDGVEWMQPFLITLQSSPNTTSSAGLV